MIFNPFQFNKRSDTVGDITGRNRSEIRFIRFFQSLPKGLTACLVLIIVLKLGFSLCEPSAILKRYIVLDKINNIQSVKLQNPEVVTGIRKITANRLSTFIGSNGIKQLETKPLTKPT